MRSRSAQDELRRGEEKRRALEARLELQEAALRAAEAAVAEARQAEAVARLDSPDPSRARDRRVAAEAALAEATSELELLRLEIEEQDRRVAARRAEAHGERVAEVTERYRAQLQRDNEQAAALNATLEQARDQSVALDVERERADALLHELVALVDDPYFDPQLPERDEPARPDGLEKLVAAIEAGARRPSDSEAAHRQTSAAERTKSDRRLVTQFVRELKGFAPETTIEQRELHDGVVARIPAHLRAEILDQVERETAAQRARAIEVRRERSGFAVGR